MWIVFALAIIIALLAIIVFARAMSMKPNAAYSAKLPQADEERSLAYGKKLGAMIRCETVSHRDQEDVSKFYEYQKVLAELFPNVFSQCEHRDFNGSLLLKWKGRTDENPILLMSHQDVVEAKGNWKHDPFSGEIIDGTVWGRGAVDTKSSGFCIFQAVEELIAEGYQPETDVYLAGSCTEEWSGGGAPATAAWLKENGIRLGMLLDEGGMIMNEPIKGVHGLYAMVGVFEKGYGDVKFSAKSKGGHASTPGKNTPWARLAAFIHHVENNNPFKAQFNPTVREMYRRMTPNMSFGMKLIFANLWLFAPILKKLMIRISPAGAAMLQTTLAFTMGKGSEGYNVLPQEAYVTGNMRFIPHQSTDESISLITSIAKKYGIDTEVIFASKPSPEVSFKSRQFALIEEILKEIYPGTAVIPYVMTGGTDARFYSDVCDNCLRFSPLYINKQQHESIHGLNENINAGVLPPGVDFFKSLIKKYN